ncbi:hypothetical protein Smp_137860 [Schistosoma mansoni]|uniref:Uncharacterized protein n=1 Tax=Schistosoma mansoni TaxID=6183 RepID=G4VGT3_SCHMA|nr:hypothetical protein Smp_137860 [Schistosoma mansoni]|eukprot:XP_018650819.1 hypothetical protein Smp_137860 [Schistosoma mansoni]
MDIGNSTKRNQQKVRLSQLFKSTKGLTCFKSDEFSRQICERSFYQLKPLPGREFNFKLCKIIMKQVLEQFISNYNGDKYSQMRSRQESQSNELLCNLTNQLRQMTVMHLKAFDIKNGGRYKLIVYVIQTNCPEGNSSLSSIMIASCGLFNRETDYYLSETIRTIFGQLIVIVYACYHE